ncbi:hypothetical protein WJX74_010699 [Apatococcus lobatus]|uniref:Uncharacterized protein n=1 Tax=Apatococcus lobatus TaxID=904363 RepID=A0AAW1SHX0_9CHLO
MKVVPDFPFCSLLEDLLTLSNDEYGIACLPGWNLDDFGTDGIEGLLLAAQGEQLLGEQEAGFKHPVAAVFTLQDAEAVVQKRSTVLHVYLTTASMRWGDTAPDEIGVFLDYLECGRGILDMHDTLITDPETGDPLAWRIDWQVDAFDRAWIAAEVSPDPYAILDYYDAIWFQQRCRLLAKQALITWKREVVENNACRALAPALLHWAAQPNGPIFKVAKRTFDQMRL